MCRPPRRQSLEAVISAALPHVTVEGTRAVPSPRLQRVYEVGIANDTTATALLLVLPPPSMLRLLRSEQLLLRSEAVLATWLAQAQPGELARREVSAPSRDGQVPCGAGDTADLPQGVPCDKDAPEYGIDHCLPSLVAHSPSSAALGSPYNLFVCPRGMAISTLPTPLTSTERRAVDYQAGRLVSRLSRLTHNSCRFGPALAVLAPPSSLRGAATTTSPVSAEAPDTWSIAFQSLLEGILRDGEDMTVVLPYSAIRRHSRRFGHLLDTVSSPRLVVVDAADDSNLLISRSPTGRGPPSSPELAQQETATLSTEAVQGVARPDVDRTGQGKHEDSSGAEDGSIAVTGLRDWSHCVFGDPLFATVFSGQPSPAFIRGFNGPRDGDDGEESEASVEASVEGGETADIRLLLYQCYHTIVQIIKEFYRPERDSSERELAARKRLNGILAKLEAVEDDPKGRHRRPSIENLPPKKPKLHGDGGSDGKAA